MWKNILGLGTPKQEKDLVALYDRVPQEKRPRHIAVIMDGNGRWAEGKGLIRTAGHRAGVGTLLDIVQVCVDLGIEVLTVYAFSTENWKRPRPEVDFLMSLFSEVLEKEIQRMERDHVRLRFLGREDGMSEKLLGEMRAAEARLAGNDGLQFNIAANYGGQDEILRAARTLAVRARAGEIAPEDIDEAMFAGALDTAGQPPVDLVIRTSGDLRLSNFLLWQSAYAEFWFTETNWPDFTPEEFVGALIDFAHRRRRFGGLNPSEGK